MFHYNTTSLRGIHQVLVLVSARPGHCSDTGHSHSISAILQTNRKETISAVQCEQHKSQKNDGIIYMAANTAT